MLFTHVVENYASVVVAVATRSARDLASERQKEAARAAKPKNLFARFFGS